MALPAFLGHGKNTAAEFTLLKLQHAFGGPKLYAFVEMEFSEQLSRFLSKDSNSEFSESGGELQPAMHRTDYLLKENARAIIPWLFKGTHN